MTTSASGQVYGDITQQIGNTALVRLNCLTKDCVGIVLAKSSRQWQPPLAAKPFPLWWPQVTFSYD